MADGAPVTRGNATSADVGVDDFRYLLEYKIPSWPATNCQLCQQGVPVNMRRAHGAEYLAKLGRSSS